jgi:hypothetical protein
VGKKAL